MLFRRSEAQRTTTRPAALAELTREADDIFRRHEAGELSLEETEVLLEELRVRYETPFDRFLAAG